mmetsp:Transcript_90837/g.236658  ORF Transcript_90837/g.236658 Transcript_90837/m.236658 type:complete len:257 (+) Transcript_90837:63-833(+)
MPADAAPATSRALEEACATAAQGLRAAVEEELAVQRSELECRGRALDQREQKLNQLQAELERREQQLIKSGVEVKSGSSPGASADGVLRGRVQSAPTPSRVAEGRCAEAPVSWTCQQGAEDEGPTGTAKAIAVRFSKLTKPEGGAAANSRAQPQDASGAAAAEGEALLADTFAAGPTAFAVQEPDQPPRPSLHESPPRGSASRLKAMFEQRAAANASASAPAADGLRTHRRTCPPAKGKLLQDLLKADEASQRSID